MQAAALAHLSSYRGGEELEKYVDSYIEEGRIAADGTLRISPTAKSTEIMMINRTDWEDFSAATGAALEDLTSRRPAPLGPSTTLLILSDTKTIDLPRAAQALVEARRQAGRVLWLNPIPQRKWPYMASIRTMASLCQMAPCSTLDELARSCRKMLK